HHHTYCSPQALLTFSSLSLFHSVSLSSLHTHTLCLSLSLSLCLSLSFSHTHTHTHMLTYTSHLWNSSPAEPRHHKTEKKEQTHPHAYICHTPETHTHTHTHTHTPRPPPVPDPNFGARDTTLTQPTNPHT